MSEASLTETVETRPDAALIAAVLTRDIFVAGLPELVRILRDRFDADARVMIDLDDGTEDARTGGILIVDNIDISVTSVPMPMPGQDELCDIARSPRDPDGTLAQHAEHVMVGSIRNPVGHEAALKAALAVLKVCYALCEADRVSAVLWYLSRVMLDRETFMEQVSPEALVDQPVPLGVLVRFGTYAEQGVDGTMRIGMTGYGFRRFIGRDLEYEPTTVPVEGVAQRLIAIGTYLMERGSIIKDGESWGWSAEDVTRARYLDQGRVLPGPVISLNIEQVDPAV